MKHQKPLYSPKGKRHYWSICLRRSKKKPCYSEYCHATQLARLLQDSDGFNQRLWFQQDGATCHSSNDSLSSVCEFFGYPKEVTLTGQLVRPDLSPVDFFLWWYLKVKSWRAIHNLNEDIREEMQTISRNTCSGHKLTRRN